MHRSRRKPARRRGGPRPHARWSLKRSRGTGPRATVSGTARFIVGRGPVPRHATIAAETRSEARRAEAPRAMEPETIAGDRPPRDGIRDGSFYRRARACPSPCSGARERSRWKPARMRVWHPRAPALRYPGQLFLPFHLTKRRQHPIRRRNGTRQQPRD